MTTLDLTEAAEFLKVHPETLRQRVKSGTIQGAKIGRSWVFIKEDLINYIRTQYAQVGQAVRVHIKQENNICHSTVERTFGGSVSQHRMENEYAKALGL